MHGKRTALIFGAGASACYEDGKSKLCTQYDFMRSFEYPKISSTFGMGAPSFSTTFGLDYSNELASYIRKKFDIPQKNGDLATLFWEELANRKIGLESLYEEIESDRSEESRFILQELRSMIQSKIGSSTAERSNKQVCRYHRKLIKALEPGDYIINFNWDSIVADALLYESPYWFPLTGHGIPILGIQGEFNNKHFPTRSHIKLYHIHGSITLFEPIEHKLRNSLKACYLVGPKGHSVINVMSDLMGITQEDRKIIQHEGIQPKPKRKVSEQESNLAAHGNIWIPEKNIWFQPIIVPPSKTKPEYKNWYSNILRRKILGQLPFTEKIIIIGYSAPRSDIQYLGNFLVPKIIPLDASIICINLDNQKSNFRKRIKSIFPNFKVDFSVKDFKEFCQSMD